MMRKFAWLIVALSMLLLTACGGDSQSDSQQADQITATILLDRPDLGNFVVRFEDGSSTLCEGDCSEISVEATGQTSFIVEFNPFTTAFVRDWDAPDCLPLQNQCRYTVDESGTYRVSVASEILQTAFIYPGGQTTVPVDNEIELKITVPPAMTKDNSPINVILTGNEDGEVFVHFDFESANLNEGIHQIDVSFTAAAPQPSLLSRQSDISDLRFRISYDEYVTYYPGKIRAVNRIAPGNTCPSVVEERAGRPAHVHTGCDRRLNSYAKPKCGIGGSDGLCDSGKNPVILVHGFLVEDGYRDDDELEEGADTYWGDLPRALHDSGLAPYIFRWRTAQRFEDAAATLRQLVDTVRSKHPGKKPLIVAHSFGGLVGRVYTQGLDSSGQPAPTSNEILALMTIGTPHSGIVKDEGAINGKRFPKGVDPEGWVSIVTSNYAIDSCLSLNCYQAGRDLDIFKPKGSNIELRPWLGLSSNHGETIYKIAYPSQDGKNALQVPLYALYGYAGFYDDGHLSPAFTYGDGLISWQGQRVHPELSCSSASCPVSPISTPSSFFLPNTHIFANKVEERVLGALNITHMHLAYPEMVHPDGFVPYAHSPSVSNFNDSTQTGVVYVGGGVANINHDVYTSIMALYEAAQPTPGTVTSPTGRVWMDRNLGASRVAQAFDDSAAFGDLYQWGRGTDGHEKRDSPTTPTLSSSDNPGHGDFITTSSSPYDWRSQQNDTLWQGVSGVNNPCPSGFRLPTFSEWQTESKTWSPANYAGAFTSPLKLVTAGYRSGNVGSIDDTYPWGLTTDKLGFYWISSESGDLGLAAYFGFGIGSTSTNSGVWSRANGFSIRCIGD